VELELEIVMRNFTAVGKEQEDRQTCYVALELHSDIGLPKDRWITLNLPDRTGVDEARAQANCRFR
jgi:hypothetical protein